MSRCGKDELRIVGSHKIRPYRSSTLSPPFSAHMHGSETVRARYAYTFYGDRSFAAVSEAH